MILYHLFKDEMDIISPIQIAINDIFKDYKNRYDFIDPYNFLHQIVFKDDIFSETLNQIKLFIQAHLKQLLALLQLQ